MESFVVKGGNKICGEAVVSGAKNAALPILAATLLTDKTIELTNCPYISDVTDMLIILRKLGCRTKRDGETIIINTAEANSFTMPEAESRKMRSSIFMVGSILSKFSKVCCVYPGGCDIGTRPIDLHLKGLRSLNVDIEERNGKIYCDAANISPAFIHLDFPSVGATENLMMAATAANGRTVIENAACEPEIADLAEFMRKIGYNVTGAGTPVVVIDGRCESDDIIKHCIMPDRIVAGTLLCAAAITQGDITLKNICVDDISGIISKLRDMGCAVKIGENSVYLKSDKKLTALAKLETMPYPGFPTDMQALMFALCCVADGTSVIVENLYENRFRHATELAKMGGSSIIKDRTAIIHGGQLHGATVDACDLRAGAALVVAALAANGVTTVENVDKYIDRGYNNLEGVLRNLGADIIRTGA